jgi:hypothetical protein
VVQSLVSSLPLCSNVHCTIKVLNSPTKGVAHFLSVSYWLVLEVVEAQYECLEASDSYGTEMTTTAYALVLPCLKHSNKNRDGMLGANKQPG